MSYANITVTAKTQRSAELTQAADTGILKPQTDRFAFLELSTRLIKSGKSKQSLIRTGLRHFRKTTPFRVQHDHRGCVALENPTQGKGHRNPTSLIVETCIKSQAIAVSRHDSLIPGNGTFGTSPPTGPPGGGLPFHYGPLKRRGRCALAI